MELIYRFVVVLSLYASCNANPFGSPDILIQGLDVVGCGFDITTLESRQCLFDLTEPSDISNWTDPHNQSLSYVVPYGFYITDESDSLEVRETKIVTNIYEFLAETFYHSRSDSRGFLGYSSSTRTVQSRSIHHRFYRFDNYLASTIQQIAWYSLSVITFPTPKYNDLTTASIATLPTTFNSTNATHLSLFKQFFDAYGTHVVLSSTMGGLVWAQDWFDSCLLRTRNTTWIREEVSDTFH
jgi:hypothetical protein